MGKVQTKIFPVLIYFPKVLPFLWFFLSSLLSKIRLLFEKIGRDGKLIALDHTLFHWFYYIILHSFSVCGRIFILLLFKWNACNWFENQFVLWFIVSLICWSFSVFLWKWFIGCSISRCHSDFSDLLQVINQIHRFLRDRVQDNSIMPHMLYSHETKK